MPGLVIIVQQGQENFRRNRGVVEAMAAEIMHEPFYTVQFFEEEEFGLHAAKVYLNHERSSGMASSDASRSVSCILSGELHAVEEITRELEQQDRTVQDPRDFSELALRLYELKGDAFLGDLNGCFTVLLVDKVRKAILIANDRFGMQPLFCCWPTKDLAIFAPELKCFRKFPGLSLTIDAEALAQCFRFSCPLSNKTFYEEVGRTPIASKFVCSDDAWSASEYWTPERIQVAPKLPRTEFVEAATARFERVVGGYCEPGATGLSLTGGWDTRAILSVLRKRTVQLPCYTFAGMYRDSFDVKLARRLAEQSGNQHYRLTLGPEFLRDFERWANKGIFVSDGASRVVRCHEYYMNRLAREHGKIRLPGRFGSQIVSGVRLLKDRSPDMTVLSPEFWRFCLGVPAPAMPRSAADVIRWELPQLEAWSQSQGAAALTVRTPYQDNELVNLMLRAPVMSDPRLLQKTIVRRNTPEWADIPTNRGAFVDKGAGAALVNGWYRTLNFVDAVYNWERLPQLGVRVARLGDRLGLTGFFNGRETWVHYRLWFAGELRDFVKKVLLDPETLRRVYWNAGFIEKMVRRHGEGTRNYAWEIDRVLGFELWCRQNRICA